MNDYFIIDFDSTFVTVESLDELARISLQTNPEKDAILSKIKQITEFGMEGHISFEESLQKRMALLDLNRTDLKKLHMVLEKNITPSIQKNKNFFQTHKDRIYIISGGFKEFIEPLAAEFGVESTHILANSFLIHSDGKIVGYDEKNPLAHKGGKAKAVESLHLSGRIIVIGDGFTDYEIRSNGSADLFIAFTENVKRENVIENADKVVSSFDEIIHEQF